VKSYNLICPARSAFTPVGFVPIGSGLYERDIMDSTVEKNYQDPIRLLPGEELTMKNPDFKEPSGEVSLMKDLQDGYHVKHLQKLKVEGKGTLLIATLWQEDE